LPLFLSLHETAVPARDGLLWCRGIVGRTPRRQGRTASSALSGPNVSACREV